MKAILISIKPRFVAKILNGEKTIEIRKTCPEMFKHLKPYEGYSIDVYIYCTKGKPSVNIWTSKTPEKVSKAILSIDEQQEDNDLDLFMNLEFMQKYPQYSGQRITFSPTNLNGKVVAKFTLNKVKEIGLIKEVINLHYTGKRFVMNKIGENIYDVSSEALRNSCLTYEEISNYLKGKKGYAWHISNLEVFDRPRELSEFEHEVATRDTVRGYIYDFKKLTKAPQSWCYVEKEKQL